VDSLWMIRHNIALSVGLGKASPLKRPLDRKIVLSASTKVVKFKNSKEEMLMSEENKAVIRKLYGEVMGKGNMAVADEIFSSDYVDHMPIMDTPDRAGLLKSVDAARRAFPDVKPRIIAEISEGDWIAIAVEADGGTHQDIYMGIPATGNHVTWT